MNLYDELFVDKKGKQNFKRFCMDVSYRIMSMVYIKNYIIASST